MRAVFLVLHTGCSPIQGELLHSPREAKKRAYQMLKAEAKARGFEKWRIVETVAGQQLRNGSFYWCELERWIPKRREWQDCDIFVDVFEVTK